MPDLQSNPFEPPSESSLISQAKSRVLDSMPGIASGILVGVIAWAPASILSFLAIALVMRWFNPAFIFHGGLVVLFWTCVAGTVVAFVTGYVLFLPAVLLARAVGVSPLLVNLLIASALAWMLPTVVISFMVGGWQTSHGMSPWLLPPACICCLVFHLHQRRFVRGRLGAGKTL